MEKEKLNMRIITSAPNFKRPASWLAYDVTNVVCGREDGPGAAVSEAHPRLFPGCYGPPLGQVMALIPGSAAIVNSDIELTTSGLGTFSKSDCVTYARRIETPSGALNPWGIDVLIIGEAFKSALRKHTGWEKFQLGAPAWDTAMVTAAVLMGLDLRRIDAPVAFHRTHEQRWDWDAWESAMGYAHRWLDGLAAAYGHTDFPRAMGPTFHHLRRWHYDLRAWRDERTRPMHFDVAPPQIQNLVWTRALAEPAPTPLVVNQKRPGLGRRLERAMRPTFHNIRDALRIPRKA